jgi:hypothetical protein
VLGNIAPDLQLYPEDIASYGANDLAELLEALEPQTRGAGGEGPIVLVNGRRASGISEIRDLPPEALQRLELLPPEVGLRYGYRANQRVVNVVLRPRFAALTTEAAHGFSTAGGRPGYEVNASLARIQENGRWNIAAKFLERDELLEGERRIEQGQGAFRTLSPAARRLTLSATYSRKLGGTTTGTISGQYDTSMNSVILRWSGR